MKDIHERRKNLIQILSGTDEFMTVKQISTLLGISERTVHNDLKYLEQSYEILKRSGVGIKLVGNHKSTNDVSLSLLDRRMEIAKLLILDDQTVTINQLSENYYVSQSSIINDLNWIKENLLCSFDVDYIATERGTRIEAKEEERIRLLVSYNNLILSMGQNTYQLKEISRILSSIYTDEICKACLHVVELLQSEQFQQKADYYLQNIYLYLVSFVYRMRIGKHQSTRDGNQLNSLQVMELTSYLLAHDVLAQINEKLVIKISPDENDIYYLAMLLRVNNISFIQTTLKPEVQSKKFVDCLIRKMSEVLDLELAENHQLVAQVSSHCIAMFERIQNRIQLRNPMINIIKQEYQAMFELVWLIIDSIDHDISNKLSEDEIGFLMLYFQNEMEKHRKSKKVIVVCPNGVVASNLIASKLREFLPPMDIIEVTSIDKIAKNDISSYSFIISTNYLSEQEIPVVQVSMLLTNQDITKIKKVYEGIDIGMYCKNDAHTYLRTKYLNRDYVLFNDGEKTKEKVITEVCEKLLDGQLVKDGFLHAVLERENISSTSIASGGAIPHASSKYVNKTCFALYVSKKPIEWGKYSVRVIIFFALAEMDMAQSKQILAEAFNFIKDKNVVDMLASTSSKNDLIELIYGGDGNDR